MADEPTSQVFIIRIWRELREKPGLPPEWRGVIEHLQSSRRVYFRDLREVTRFIRPFIEEMSFPRLAPQRAGGVVRNVLDFLRGNRRHE